MLNFAIDIREKKREIRLITSSLHAQIMTAELKKPENAALETSDEAKQLDPRDELKLTRADLVDLKKKFNVLSTNYKRAQSKIERLEKEKDAVTSPKDAASVKREPDAGTAKPVRDTIVDTEQASSVSSKPSHVDHLQEWVPPYCGEHGCKNDLFKDEVFCPNCKGPLGSEKYAKHQLSACPLCGVNAGYNPRPGYKLQHDGCTGPECRIKA
jgi:outer membrane murein-binding lipoprotein Lpp